MKKLKKITSQHKIFSLLIIVSSSLIMLASSGGIVGKTKKNGAGCTCHNNDATSAVVVKIDGPSELKTGEVATYTLKILGGPLIAAGTNIASSNGLLQTISGEGLQLVNGGLTHTSPKIPIGDTVTFKFKFVAPNQTGSSILYATGNSVNNNGTDAGDRWNHASNKTINIIPLTNIDKNNFTYNFSLEQNYPNPFNSTTTIQFSLSKESHTKIDIIDKTGKVVDRIVNKVVGPGSHFVSYNASHLSSGIYFYKLQTEDKSSIRKMLFLK